MAKTKYNTIKRTTTFYHEKVEKFFKKFERKSPMKFTTKRSVEAIFFLIIFFAFFGLLAYKMTLPKMLNTFMQTAYHLLLETVFYIMAICVLMGAISKLLTEFGVVRLLENLLRPLMKPLYNLPGVAALGAVMTFLTTPPSSPSPTTKTSTAISRNTNSSRSPTSAQPSAWALWWWLS